MKISQKQNCKLGEIAEITSSKRIFLSDYVEKGIPFYRSKEIIEKSLKQPVTQKLYISREKYLSIKNQFGIPENGDILISAVGERAGIPYVVNNDGDFYFKDGNLIWLRKFSKTLSSKYLYHYLKSEIGQRMLESSMIGSAQKALTIIGLKNFEISLPSVAEQEAIAEVLNSLDDKIDLLHRNNKTLEQLAETLFRNWFVESEKAGWLLSNIGKHVSMFGGGTPSTNNPEFWDGEIAWTSPRDLSNCPSLFLKSTQKKITNLGLQKIGSGLLPIGTVLMSSRAPIGYLSITNMPVAINQGYIAFVCDKELSNYFLHNWLKWNMESIINAANGSTFLEISKAVFKGLTIALPPQELLTQFDTSVQPLYNKILINEHQIKKLETLRDYLLPKLISGDIKVEN